MSLFRAAVVAAATLFVGSFAIADDYWVYFGTNTGGKDAKKGIFRSRFDTKTGKLTEAELAAEVEKPSFVAIDPIAGKYLYAIGETEGPEGGGVFTFSIDPKTGALTKVSQSTSGGKGPCHVALDATGMMLATANYTGGSAAVFSVPATGSLVNKTGFFQHKEEGKTPHAHCSVFHPTTNVLYVVDLGLDKIKAYTLQGAQGTFKESPKDDIVLPAGAGPRHLTIAPDGKFGYVCGEKDMTVNVIEFSGNGGKVVQSLSTIPTPTQKGYSTAECILDKTGKHVYVSNRGYNTIAVFNVGDDRKLTAAGQIKGDIKTPRNFAIDPSGKWMLIASQDGGKVGVWELDPATGLAKETGDTGKVPKAVCVRFVPVAK